MSRPRKGIDPADYADDILLLKDCRAHETADRCRIHVSVVLRVLVPHFKAKGLSPIELALRLGVCKDTVLRHLKPRVLKEPSKVCRNGHLRTVQNTRVSNGRRVCRPCDAEAHRRRRAA